MRVALLRIVLIAITVLSTEASRADEIVLGVSTPMTGPAAPFVQGVLDGVRMAVGEINARGGISGKQLRLVAYDDQCNPGLAAANTQRMILQDKVAALIGYSCGATALAASELAAKYDVLLVAIAQSATVGKRGPRFAYVKQQRPPREYSR